MRQEDSGGGNVSGCGLDVLRCEGKTSSGDDGNSVLAMCSVNENRCGAGGRVAGVDQGRINPVRLLGLACKRCEVVIT